MCYFERRRKFVTSVKARKSCRESWGMTIATREWRWISLQMWLPKLWNDFTHVTQLLWKYWESLYKIAFCNNISRFYNMIDGYVSSIVPRKSETLILRISNINCSTFKKSSIQMDTHQRVLMIHFEPNEVYLER